MSFYVSRVRAGIALALSLMLFTGCNTSAPVTTQEGIPNAQAFDLPPGGRKGSTPKIDPKTWATAKQTFLTKYKTLSVLDYCSDFYVERWYAAPPGAPDSVVTYGTDHGDYVDVWIDAGQAVYLGAYYKTPDPVSGYQWYINRVYYKCASASPTPSPDPSDTVPPSITAPNLVLNQAENQVDLTCDITANIQDGVGWQQQVSGIEKLAIEVLLNGQPVDHGLVTYDSVSGEFKIHLTRDEYIAELRDVLAYHKANPGVDLNQPLTVIAKDKAGNEARAITEDPEKGKNAQLATRLDTGTKTYQVAAKVDASANNVIVRPLMGEGIEVTITVDGLIGGDLPHIFTVVYEPDSPNLPRATGADIVTVLPTKFGHAEGKSTWDCRFPDLKHTPATAGDYTMVALSPFGGEQVTAHFSVNNDLRFNLRETDIRKQNSIVYGYAEDGTPNGWLSIFPPPAPPGSDKKSQTAILPDYYLTTVLPKVKVTAVQDDGTPRYNNIISESGKASFYIDVYYKETLLTTTGMRTYNVHTFRTLNKKTGIIEETLENAQVQ